MSFIGAVGRRSRLLVDQWNGGGRAEVIADLRRWSWSETHAIGFRRWLHDDVDPPAALVDLRAVPIDAALAPEIFEIDGLGSMDQLYLDRRRAIYQAGFSGGWAAVDPDGRPAYVQWLIPSSEVDHVRAFFGALFPEMPDDTLYVEGAWIPPAFRKQKVMGEGLALVTAAAAKQTPDARQAVCFVTDDNRGAAFGTRSAGYSVFMKRTERWRLGRRTRSFVEATEADFALFGERPDASRP